MKILIVDDDPRLRDLVRIALDRAGHQTVTASDGQQALDRAARDTPDLIVLDVGLPEHDGFEVCRRLRARGDEVPVLFLTARDDEIDRVVGLELGADDYVTKPFSPRELVARVAAILKRSRPSTPRRLTQGALVLDPARHGCTLNGAPVALTATEMAILLQLATRPDHVQARPALVDAVFGRGSPVSDRTLDSHVRNLRAKLATAGCHDAIETVHGVGLRLGPCST
ncbi:DNA-binding response regulator [Jannaschia pagri]|uniref:DNA-binding response regulator n=1 Tax=Jannaschia pagri TaxID=2829797 RepID=A0ABQ4NR45_9RHOB|nr:MULTISPECIES: response regulator transcription factor [unclassified Jannaschia]GIT93044.1 DNA-binding response regulator [Jannaschia sp. AI_61]GIT96879.1 DNA-binding response regulator [Jannaschia sp. AI_62]